MKFKYELTPLLIEKAKDFGEFAHGGSQATIKLKDGTIFEQAIISNCSVIIAMRGYEDLPFELNEIEDIYQKEEDIWPKDRNGHIYWDEWKT